MRPQHFAGGLALAALSLLAACSGGGPGIATASGGNGGVTTTSFDAEQAFLDYSHCMRDNGVSDYPDPVQEPGHDGLSLNYDGDHSASSFESADAACHHFVAPIIQQKQQAVRDQLTPERVAGLTAYARCMRDHGIPLADPDPSDGHISFDSSLGFGADIGRRDAPFTDADVACRSQLPAGVADDGTGPP
jgi:hypothetical protein